MLDLHTRKKQSATVRLGVVNPMNPIFKALQLLSYFREKGQAKLRKSADPSIVK